MTGGRPPKPAQPVALKKRNDDMHNSKVDKETFYAGIERPQAGVFIMRNAVGAPSKEDLCLLLEELDYQGIDFNPDKKVTHAHSLSMCTPNSLERRAALPS